MGAITIALGVLVCAYASALLGMFAHGRMTERPLDTGSRDAMRLVMGLVAATVALVLGGLVASAHAGHRQHDSQLRELSADILLLDRTLQLYGPDAQAVRRGMRDVARRTHQAVSAPMSAAAAPLGAPATQQMARNATAQLAGLTAKTDTQRLLQGQALQQADSIAKSHLLISHSLAHPTPWMFLGVLVFWISVLFFGFGLMARFSVAVAAALFMGAFSVAGAIFLILDLSEPFGGLIRISDLPLRGALAQFRR